MKPPSNESRESAQAPPPGLPVVVGSSFSGLLLSIELSSQGIEHVLVGGEEPDDTPRLGESLNECASPELFGRFSEKYPECFHTKSHIALLNGEYATAVHFGDPDRCEKITSRYNTSAGPWPHGSGKIFWASVTSNNLMHCDRITLDKHVYREAIAEESCHLVKSLVSTVETENDKVVRLVLENGTVLDSPRYVLDATGFRGVIAKAFDVGLQPMSSTQRVVWAHMHTTTGKELPRRWWRQGTNLLKHLDEIDGYDGISWLIPLGDYVSIGVSLDLDRYPEEQIDDETVIQKLVESYERRGLDVSSLFPDRRRPICELKHAYYQRDRAYGANWLLAGNTYKAVWFPTSSGLWMTVAACRLLPHLFERPHELGAHYEHALSQLDDFHEFLEGMIHGEPFHSHKQAMAFWSRWLSGVSMRLGIYLDMPRADRPSIGYRFRFLKAFGLICRKAPLIQRFTWGNFVTRTAHQPDLGQQSSAFKDYFSRARLSLKNYLSCSARWLNPFTS